MITAYEQNLNGSFSENNSRRSRKSHSHNPQKPPNNQYGVPGTRKCQACRQARKKCLFNEKTSPCVRCAEAGKSCGPKLLPKREKHHRSPRISDAFKAKLYELANELLNEGVKEEEIQGCLETLLQVHQAQVSEPHDSDDNLVSTNSTTPVANMRSTRAEFDPRLGSLNLNWSDYPSSSHALHGGNEQTIDPATFGFLPAAQPSSESFSLRTDLTSPFSDELQYPNADENFGLDGFDEWFADYDEQGTHTLQNPACGYSDTYGYNVF